MSNKVRSLVAEVLETGLDDWMPIFHVIDRASVLSGQERRLSGDIVMAALQIFVENDMLTAGYLGEFGFEAWGLEPRQALGAASGTNVMQKSGILDCAIFGLQRQRRGTMWPD